MTYNVNIKLLFQMFPTLTAVLILVLISVTNTSGCRQCTVNGQQYRGNSRFQFTNGCSRYNCMCNCDGSWNCPAQDTTNDCSGSNNGGSQSNCRQCQLSGQTYAGNSRFQYTDGCYQFNCDCHCDGSWTCPGSRTQNICWKMYDVSLNCIWLKIDLECFFRYGTYFKIINTCTKLSKHR